MRIALISDVHANLEALLAVHGDIAGQGIDLIVCLGDAVGYNTDPAACLDLLGETCALCVAGNHDLAVAGRITTGGFSVTAARAVSWTHARLSPAHLDLLDRLPLQACVGRDLVAVHGALLRGGGCAMTRLDNGARRMECFAALAAHPSGARVCAFGHTHQVGVFEMRAGLVHAVAGDEVRLRDDAIYLVNPGSVGQPRSADRRATYIVLDTQRQALVVRRLGYDAEAALAKTRAGGLAPGASAVPAPLRAALRRGLRTIGLLDVALRARGVYEQGRSASLRTAGQRPADHPNAVNSACSAASLCQARGVTETLPK